MEFETNAVIYAVCAVLFVVGCGFYYKAFKDGQGAPEEDEASK